MGNEINSYHSTRDTSKSKYNIELVSIFCVTGIMYLQSSLTFYDAIKKKFESLSPDANRYHDSNFTKNKYLVFHFLWLSYRYSYTDNQR